jgi:gas vesicle protein
MNTQQGGSFVLGLLMGAIAGAVIALLYAPKSGKETRAFIGEKLAGMRQTVEGEVTKARHTMGEKISGEECSPTGSATSGHGA